MILGKVRNCTSVDLILSNPKTSFYCCCLAYAISKKIITTTIYRGKFKFSII